MNWQILACLGLSLMLLGAADSFAISETNNECILEKIPSIDLTENEFYKNLSREDKEKFFRELKASPTVKVWKTSTEQALHAKIQESDLVMLGSIAPYEGSLWDSSDLVEVVTFRFVEVDFHVLEVYRANKNLDVRYSFDDKQNRQVKVSLPSALLYTSIYGMSIAELRSQVDSFISEFGERWKKLRSEYSAKDANQSEYHAKLSDLKKQWAAHKYGAIAELPGGIVLTPFDFVHSTNALCGLQYLTTGQNYIFFLRKTASGEFELAGRQSVLPDSFDAVLRKVLAEDAQQ